ncbi:aspartate/glutamate racemase family protein [Perlabentimonas gracilis]|uniref:aspartate/glutamate racemase family protein n=1 Tax=Perlabentimonas gracilis TaxID=2715279 RepID=UPI00140AD02D|nr:aspartate/glutamate racemase family protein [Perlabentimonas gracilis]NHB69040.1 aspartate/glutamate racemase family protein [Perlabentimonas gracilis]
MKTIGFIGGMSWESSVVYYELANRKVRQMLGGFHSCQSIMYTVDFDPIQKLQHEDRWAELDTMMAQAAVRLERAGADIIVLCTNTMHLCEKAIMSSISIPFLHIAEATGQEIAKRGIDTIALLGTKFTMERDFYKGYLNDKFGIKVLIPNDEDRNTVHNIIYGELVQGQIKPDSRQKYVDIIAKLEAQDAQGVILGCTEIPLLISDADVNIPTFNTTQIHAEKAVEWALKH